MKQYLAQTTLVVRDYDEAIDFYVNTLGFTLVEDSPVPDPHMPEAGKRWVVVAPPGSPGAPGSSESRLLLAKAVGPEQESRIGNQTGGRVFLFLFTDDFWRDHAAFTFVRGEPRAETYGTVPVFLDLYGNMWDLIEPKD
ncbi:MAG: VOC family protein [Alphaproteobacteria bacterium]